MEASVMQVWYEQRGHPGLTGSLKRDGQDKTAILDWLGRHADVRTKERLQTNGEGVAVAPLDEIERDATTPVAEFQSSLITEPVERREALVFYEGALLTVQRRSLTDEFHSSLFLAGVLGAAAGGVGGLVGAIWWPWAIEGVDDPLVRFDRFVEILPYTGPGLALLGVLAGLLLVYLIKRPTDNPRVGTVHDDPQAVFETLGEADELGVDPEGVRRLFGWARRNGAEPLLETEAVAVLSVGSDYVLCDWQNDSLRHFKREGMLRAAMKHKELSRAYAVLDARL